MRTRRNTDKMILESLGKRYSNAEKLDIIKKEKTISKDFFANSKIEKINIPYGITSIGNEAFRNCFNLTEIMIPDSVTSIGDHAFEYCTRLTEIMIPNSVTSIGNYTFKRCRSLTEITLPNSVTSIGSWAFYDCARLTKVNIGNNVRNIEDYAFLRCKSLTSITIPNSVRSIGHAAFAHCSSLTEITIPNSVTSIGEHAFSHCRNLKQIKCSEHIAEQLSSFDGEIIITDGTNESYKNHKLNDRMILESLITKYGKSGVLNAINKINEAERSLWAGVPEVYLIWYGDWADAEVEYDGCRCSEWDIQDSMTQYMKECNAAGENWGDPENDDDFCNFCQAHAAEVQNDIIEFSGVRYMNESKQLNELKSETLRSARDKALNLGRKKQARKFNDEYEYLKSKEILDAIYKKYGKEFTEENVFTDHELVLSEVRSKFGDVLGFILELPDMFLFATDIAMNFREAVNILADFGIYEGDLQLCSIDDLKNRLHSQLSIVNARKFAKSINNYFDGIEEVDWHEFADL